MKTKTKILSAIGAISAGVLGLIGGGIVVMNINSQVLYGVPNGYSEQEYFNRNFSSYEGTFKGSAIKSLYSTIINSSGLYDSYEREVKYSGPELNEISALKYYEVEMKYDEDGFICEVIVTEINNDDNVVNK